MLQKGANFDIDDIAPDALKDRLGRVNQLILGSKPINVPVYQYHEGQDGIVPFGQASTLRSAYCNQGMDVQWTVLDTDAETPVIRHISGICQGNDGVDQFIKDNRFMEFKVWDPHSMKNLIRFNQLHKFIGFYFERGDKADKALILHAHKVAHKIITFLQRELNVVKLDGVTIKDFYQLCEKDSRACSDEIDIAKVMLGEQINKE